MHTRYVRRGKIHFRRLVYEHEQLACREGQPLLVMRDPSIDDADIIVFTLDKRFLCNAHNVRKWAVMTA